MGTSAVQCNTRMDAVLKRSGDAVLERCGVTPSEAVRALWDYAATHQSLPPFVLAYARTAKNHGACADDPDGNASPRARAQSGCGLALAVARAECSFSPKPSPEPHVASDWHELRDAMYDDLLAEMELRCR